MFKINNRFNRTPFDSVVLVNLFLSFHMKHVSHLVLVFLLATLNIYRGGSRAAATSKMKHFVIIVKSTPSWMLQQP